MEKSVPPAFSWASIQKWAWPHQHPEDWIQLEIQIICLSVLFFKINTLVNPRHEELMYYFTHVDVFPFILILVFSMLTFSLHLPVVCPHVLWLCWPTGWRFLPPCVHQHDCKYILSWWTWQGSNLRICVPCHKIPTCGQIVLTREVVMKWLVRKWMEFCGLNNSIVRTRVQGEAGMRDPVRKAAGAGANMPWMSLTSS